jgi:hypothetical protein
VPSLHKKSFFPLSLTPFHFPPFLPVFTYLPSSPVTRTLDLDSFLLFHSNALYFLGDSSFSLWTMHLVAWLPISFTLTSLYLSRLEPGPWSLAPPRPELFWTLEPHVLFLFAGTVMAYLSPLTLLLCLHLSCGLQTCYLFDWFYSVRILSLITTHLCLLSTQPGLKIRSLQFLSLVPSKPCSSCPFSSLSWKSLSPVTPYFHSSAGDWTF